MLLTGHVTKDGDLAGPRTLEHAVDVVLTFDGDPRSGPPGPLRRQEPLRGGGGDGVVRDGRAGGCAEIDPTDLLVSGSASPGAAIALPQAGRRALAVEVQALVGATDGSGQASGDRARPPAVPAGGGRPRPRRRASPLGRCELFGASSGGVRLDDPACDLAIAAALASAATGVAPPAGSAFVGEVALTGQVRSAPSMAQRVAAARAAGCSVVYAAAGGPSEIEGVRVRACSACTRGAGLGVSGGCAVRNERRKS